MRRARRCMRERRQGRKSWVGWTRGRKSECELDARGAGVDGECEGLHRARAPHRGGARNADRARDATVQAQELGADHAWQVLYHSTDLSDRDIAVSALVLLPQGTQPATGWPVIAWAHGTSGLADQCAPSIAPGLAHDPTAVKEVRALVARGWAVVASDYPGLGTPGRAHVSHRRGRRGRHRQRHGRARAARRAGRGFVAHGRAFRGRPDRALRRASRKPARRNGGFSARSRSRRRRRSTRSSRSPRQRTARSSRRT